MEKEKHKPACYGEIDFDYWELECYDCKFLERCKKDSKKVLTSRNKSDTIMGKGKGDRVEAVSFMPEPNPIDNKDIVEVNTDKVKQNLLARNKYMLSKQTEQEEIQERRRKEQRERNRTYWKRNSNKKE